MHFGEETTVIVGLDFDRHSRVVGHGPPLGAGSLASHENGAETAGANMIAHFPFCTSNVCHNDARYVERHGPVHDRIKVVPQPKWVESSVSLSCSIAVNATSESGKTKCYKNTNSK